MTKTAALTAERILQETEEVLRTHGASRATVMDVARALGVSHGTVYRHFRTKAELREAVTRRWLKNASGALVLIVQESGESAPDKLRRWLSALFAAKRRKAGEDPQLFATYEGLLGEHSQVVEEHIGELVGQIEEILEQGVARGEFRYPHPDPAISARAVFDATAPFHDPKHAAGWHRSGIETEFSAVLDLVLLGVTVPS
ncbi:TetR family transcriptional regulator [Streptomyces albus]|uniref:TetR family transcriptional regulator n=1 Tax=Streptomyces albus (strain ATCC 21838 / DSM 41398 / FERM P-419 / JCM 4703 / NBRC 107858) TaxID=1081613 RepID=A0A0B5F2D1_STRA4|nr:TetR family transcriptional regulator [Streptomyces albus]AOU80048.1 TetR family transcriptional regulator [Streptomyces albus]AYN35766.1 TetR/AcrR family transcriptional regulator [Streptomyces albus]